MTTKFSFDVSFQRAMLRLCMIDETFNHKAMEHLDASYFTTRALGWVFRVMEDHYTSYGMRCTNIPLLEAPKHVTDEHAPVYAAEVEKIIELGVIAEDAYIKEQLQDFVRRNLFAQAHQYTMQLYNDGKYVECYDVMQKAMDQIRLVEFNVPDRSWFFERLGDRQKERYRAKMDPSGGVFTTGIMPLDEILDGGVKLGELFIVTAYPKIGKTTWLINQAFLTARVSREPVLYINLEGRTNLIENRLDSCFSSELYTNVKKGDISPTIYREMVAEYNMLRRLLVIRTFNDWDCNVLHIDSELTELKSMGFVPKLIVLDYVDLLRSRFRQPSETQQQIDATKDVKKLANRGYGIWSACQAKRPSRKDHDEKEHLVKAADIAEAFGKIRVSDGYGSLNATKAEREMGITRLYWEGYRDAPVGKVFKLENDPSRMRIAKKVSVLRVEDEDEEKDDYAD